MDEATRIPLDAIEAAFFGSDDDDIQSKNDSDSDGHEIPENEMNDYTVIRLGDKPKPQPVPIPKYPKYKVSAIEYAAPSVYEAPKRRVIPEPEYEPPQRPKPRPVNSEDLSPAQMEMYGKTPFEQDLVIIRRKKERLRKNAPPPDPNTVPAKQGVKVPSVYKTEEASINRRKEERRMLEEREKKRAEKEEKRAKKKAEQDKLRSNELRQEREKRMLERELARLEQERAETLEKIQRREELEANWNPNRPTRASQLKGETCRRMLETRHVEERRDKLHAEMRRERSKKETARLKNVLERLRPSDEGKGTADRRRKEFRDKQRQWIRWLRLTEAENEQKQPMLERLFANDHIPEVREKPGKKVDANMID